MFTILLYSLYAFLAGVPYFWQLAAGCDERIFIGKLAVGEIVTVAILAAYTWLVRKCANAMYGKQK